MDLTFKTENGRFNYRVGAIIIHDNKILMVKNELSPYFYSVGGRVKLNETAEQAVLREVYEETGIHMEVDRLGFVHECFFVEEVTKERFHELSFYFYIKAKDIENIRSNSYTELGAKEGLFWLPLDRLNEFYIYPEFFREKILSPITELQHILTVRE